MKLPLENLRSPAALSRFYFTAIIGVAVDLWTKVLAQTHLQNPPRDIRIIPGFLHFHYTENPGAVFGSLAGQRWPLVCVSIFAILFLSWLFLTSGRQRLFQVVLGMLLAGALGNLYDRLKFGIVRDMIFAFPDWGIFPWIFNVADMLLCTGMGLLLFHMVFYAEKPGEGPVNAEPASRSTRVE